jgi:hypothetical protein
MKKIIIIFLGILLVLGIVIQCKFDDPTDNLSLNIDYNIIENAVGLTFTDAATGNLLNFEDQEIEITISGDDANVILDGTGKLRSIYNVNIGALSLAINPSRIPSESNPIRFRIDVITKGYLPVCKHLEVSRKGLTPYSVEMIQVNNPPEGVNINLYDNIGQASNGVVQSAITVGNVNENFKVIIPANSILSDKKGRKLNGDLSVKQINYSAVEGDALRFMPGGDGGLVMNIINKQGDEEETMFVSAGFYDLSITDASGREAKDISNGAIQISYPVEGDVVNPNTSQAVQKGEEIPLWSYSQESNKWTYENTATAQNVNGSLQFVATMSHLSTWNFDWKIDDYCELGGTITFTSNESNERYDFEVSIYDANTGVYIASSTFYGTPNNLYQLRQVPRNRESRIVFRTNDSRIYQLPSDFVVQNLCNFDKTIPLELETSNEGVSVYFIGHCASNKNIIVKPTYYGFVLNTTQMKFNWVQVINGKAVVKGLTQGDQLIVGTFYKKWYFAEITYTGQESYYYDFTLPDELCDGF